MSRELIAESVGGIAYLTEENGVFGFHRFTREQEEFYREQREYAYKNTATTAGVCFEFETDSRTVRLAGMIRATTVSFSYAFDLLVNGALAESEVRTLTEVGESCEFSVGFILGEGMKRVKLLLPFNAETKLYELELDSGAHVKPIKREKRMLCFGDSITQGYLASSPSRTYPARIAEALNVSIVNKAIDGEVFRARLGALRDAFEPDFITVAYGTNDWNKLTKAKFEANCLGFYENLSRSYPNTRIFAITPLWRGDFEDETHGCSFAHLEDFICRVADGAANVTPLRGFDFVPHDPELFADGFLHPNDDGFRHYASGLDAALQELEL